MSWSEDDLGKPFFPTRFGSPQGLVFKEAKTAERKKTARIQTMK